MVDFLKLSHGQTIEATERTSKMVIHRVIAELYWMRTDHFMKQLRG